MFSRISIIASLLSATAFGVAVSEARVIGNDDRKEVVDGTAAHRALARNVGLAVPWDQLSVARDGVVTLDKTSGEVCAFPDQAGVSYAKPRHTSAWEQRRDACDATLLSPTRALIAWDCLTKDDFNRVADGYPPADQFEDICDNLAVVFDFAVTKNGTALEAPSVAEEDVFRCSEIVGLANMAASDVLVVELDRDTTRPGSLLQMEPKSTAHRTLVVGHPLGLPTKLDVRGETRPGGLDPETNVLPSETDLTSSGAAVFEWDDPEGRLSGLIVDATFHLGQEQSYRVVSDYERSEDNSCWEDLRVQSFPQVEQNFLLPVAALGRFRDTAEPNETRAQAARRPRIFRAANDGSGPANILRSRSGGDAAGHHEIRTGTDVDYFAIPVVGGDDLEIEINFEHRFGDLDMAIENEQGVVLRTSAGVQNKEAISLSIPGDGLFPVYLKVYGWGGSMGSYDLDIVLRPSAGRTCDFDVGCGTEVCNPRAGVVEAVPSGTYDLTRNAGVCEPRSECTTDFFTGQVRCGPAEHAIHLPINRRFTPGYGTWNIAWGAPANAFAELDFDYFGGHAPGESFQFNGRMVTQASQAKGAPESRVMDGVERFGLRLDHVGQTVSGPTGFKMDRIVWSVPLLDNSPRQPGADGGFGTIQY